MPDVTIDPNLSVHGLARRSSTQRSLPRHRYAMLIMSHEIEYTVIMGAARPRIFAGFQRMSRFLPQVDRYARIAPNAESVYVFGIMDAEPPPMPNVSYVPLDEGDQLANEWFVIAEAPDYFSALTSIQIAYPEADEMPSFDSMWTFDEDTVTILQEQLSTLVDAQPLGDLAATRDSKQEIGILTNSMFRLTNRLVGTIGNLTPANVRMAQDLSFAVQEEIGPAIKTMADNLKSETPPPSTDDFSPTV